MLLYRSKARRHHFESSNARYRLWISQLMRLSNYALIKLLRHIRNNEKVVAAPTPRWHFLLSFDGTPRKASVESMTISAMSICSSSLANLQVPVLPVPYLEICAKRRVSNIECDRPKTKRLREVVIRPYSEIGERHLTFGQVD